MLPFLREEVYVLDSSDKDIIELVRNTLLQLAMQKHHFTIYNNKKNILLFTNIKTRKVYHNMYTKLKTATAV